MMGKIAKQIIAREARSTICDLCHGHLSNVTELHENAQEET